MTDQDDKYDIHFFQMAFSLYTAAMQQMGKVISPLTGKVERDLGMAKNSIDMLEMLQRKTNGNLSDEENKLVEHYLYELRMNYVDEANKGETPPESEEAPDEKPAEASAGKPGEEKSGPVDNDSQEQG
jgi:hypothetical protein